MNEELYRLCKKVYEKFPDWYDTDKHYWNGTKPEPLNQQAYEFGKTYGACVPLYASDYIFEKLPNNLIYHLDDYTKSELGLLQLTHCEDGNWLATYSKLKLNCYADTGLKALLKLTIALHEGGEL